MKIKLLNFIFLIFITSQISCGQTTSETLILGKWKGVKEETKDGYDKLRDGRTMENLYEFDFKKGNIVSDPTLDNESYEYHIDGKILKLGRLYFIIEKLTNESLILLDYDPTDKYNSLAFRHYFKKVKSS